MTHAKLDKDQILSLIKAGLPQDEIARRLNVGKDTLSYFISKKFHKGFYSLRHDSIKEDLEHEVLSGNNHIFRIRQRYGYTPVSFYGVVRNLGMLHAFNKEKAPEGFALFELKEILAREGSQRIDSLVEEGASLSDISKHINVTRQMVDTYIRGSGQHNLWLSQECRGKRKKMETDLESAQKNILQILTNKLHQDTTINETDSIDKKVEKYTARYTLFYNAGQIKRLNIQRVREVLSIYFNAQENGETPSFLEISNQAGNDYAATSEHILKRLGLNSMRWNNNHLSDEQKRLLKRASKTVLSLKDVKYFFGINSSTTSIGKYFHQHREKQYSGCFASLGHNKGCTRIPYREISQVYDAVDLGFTRDEIGVLFPNRHSLLIDKVLENRQNLSERITKNLKRVCPDRQMNHSHIQEQ